MARSAWIGAQPAATLSHAGSVAAVGNDFTLADVIIAFDVSGRRIGQIVLPLWRHSIPLAEALAEHCPTLPRLVDTARGYTLRALPEQHADELLLDSPYLPLLRQRYERSYVDLQAGYDAWLAGLSGNTRQTLRRKYRKLERHCGGVVDVRVYRTPAEMAEFFPHARAISAASYQERLLASGLPENSLPVMTGLAEQDMVRGFLLWIDGSPVAYLYAPALGDTLLYAYLGYDEGQATHSPGSVLQLEALRLLMEEGRFRWFDFAEGGGQHKQSFATGTIPSVDLLLLKPTLRNRMILWSLASFDRLVAIAKSLATRFGLHGLRKLIRR
ncbi:MAG: GNAT family N-acetyltransferase [Sphingomonadaceae bacterium]